MIVRAVRCLLQCSAVVERVCPAEEAPSNDKQFPKVAHGKKDNTRGEKAIILGTGPPRASQETMGRLLRNDDVHVLSDAHG